MKKQLGDKYDNYRDHYYYDKLNIKLPGPLPLLLLFPENKNVLNQVCRSYYEGLQWIFLYYYRGVASWSWYYPYHYCPLASDLAKYSMSLFSFSFTLGSSSRSPSERLTLPSCSNLAVSRPSRPPYSPPPIVRSSWTPRPPSSSSTQPPSPLI